MKQDWQNNYFLILFAAAALHGLYLAAYIALRPGKGKALSYLSITMIGVTALLVNYLLFISNAIISFPNLLGVLTPIMYVTGPAFYFFVRKSENTKFKLHPLDVLHLAPIVYFGFRSWQIFIQPAGSKLEAIQSAFSQTPPPILEIILDSPFNIITATYAVACIVFLSNRLKIKSSNSLRWLRKFSFAFLILLISSVSIPIIFILTNVNGAYMELTITLLYAISIHILGYVILRKEFKSIGVGSIEKYATSPLDPQLLETYQHKIVAYLEREKPWLKSEFSIGDLSKQLSMPKHHISQVLNEKMEMSFNDLVNSFRIDEVKSRLASGDINKFSVFGIATDCGFSSKSTFNRIFKKYTGLTPTTYLLTITGTEQIGSAS